MGIDYRVRVPNDKGARREAGSEGSLRQTSGPRDTNPIGGLGQLGELADQSKALAAEGCPE